MKEFIKVVVAFYMAINLPLFLFACLRQMFDRTGPRKMLRIELLFPGAILGRMPADHLLKITDWLMAPLGGYPRCGTCQHKKSDHAADGMCSGTKCDSYKYVNSTN